MEPGIGARYMERGCGAWKKGVVPGNRAYYMATGVKYLARGAEHGEEYEGTWNLVRRVRGRGTW